jgi:hypothetical protein
MANKVLRQASSPYSSAREVTPAAIVHDQQLPQTGGLSHSRKGDVLDRVTRLIRARARARLRPCPPIDAGSSESPESSASPNAISHSVKLAGKLRNATAVRPRRTSGASYRRPSALTHAGFHVGL